MILKHNLIPALLHEQNSTSSLTLKICLSEFEQHIEFFSCLCTRRFPPLSRDTYNLRNGLQHVSMGQERFCIVGGCSLGGNADGSARCARREIFWGLSCSSRTVGGLSRSSNGADAGACSRCVAAWTYRSGSRDDGFVLGFEALVNGSSGGSVSPFIATVATQLSSDYTSGSVSIPIVNALNQRNWGCLLMNASSGMESDLNQVSETAAVICSRQKSMRCVLVVGG